MFTGMREVTCDEFFKAIDPLDVEVTTRGNYSDEDYGSDFHLKYPRRLVGRTLRIGGHPSWKPESRYFLATEK